MERSGSPSVPPGSYAEWCVWLDALGRGDCDSELLRLAALSRTIWTAAVAGLFATRVHEAMNDRLNRLGRSLEQRLGRCRDETSVTLALVQTRQEFQALGRFAEIETFPEALRQGLRDLVRQHVATRQETLEKSALADRSGRLALAVRRSPLDQPGSARSPGPSPFPSGDAAPARRIILDQPG